MLGHVEPSRIRGVFKWRLTSPEREVNTTATPGSIGCLALAVEQAAFVVPFFGCFDDSIPVETNDR